MPLISFPRTATGTSVFDPWPLCTPTAPAPLPERCSRPIFVLERKQGNIIIYHSPGINAATHEILGLGRPSRLLLNHWHEAM